MQRIGCNAKIGITPMIGVNDAQSEIFTIEDAKMVTHWALQNSYIGLIAFWELGRDTNVWNKDYSFASNTPQDLYGFTKVFSAFAKGSVGPVSTTASVAEWNTCLRSSDCANSGDTCCPGSAADKTANKLTCRPAGHCYISRTTSVQANVLLTESQNQKRALEEQEFPPTDSANSTEMPTFPIATVDKGRGMTSWPARFTAPYFFLSANPTVNIHVIARSNY